MNTAYARQQANRQPAKVGQPARVQDAAHARAIYLQSSSRIDLVSVGRIFEAAPDEVELSGKLVKK